MTKQEEFKQSIEENNIELVKLLLADPRVNPADDNNYAFCYAIYNGYTNVVRLLISDPRVNPSNEDNYAIRWAAKEGNVKLLLSESRVNLADNCNYSIVWANKRKHSEIVKLLFSVKNVKKTLKNDDIELYNQLMAKEVGVKIAKFS